LSIVLPYDIEFVALLMIETKLIWAISRLHHPRNIEGMTLDEFGAGALADGRISFGDKMSFGIPGVFC
jgi:hypothetical protein